MKTFVLPILVSALATFIPRVIPYWVSFLDKLPPLLSRMLRLLPVAALGPLIFPGVFLDYVPHLWAGFAGIAAAFILAYFKGGMILPILSSIVVTYLALLFGA
ncbi:MAG: AzlD domain-containing protein [Spirochaetales bacterium]|nr:AzlD domain-containing protein [Spirochaetales bacterium]